MVFPRRFDVSLLNGTNGFTVNGINAINPVGRSVSGVGDFNGDGFDDAVMSAFAKTPHGQSYLLFGSDSGFSPFFNLSDLNGANGFIMNTTQAVWAGWTVSGGGDFNGDGIKDTLVGGFAPNGQSGKDYIVFGSRDKFSPVLNLENLDGHNGLIITNTIPNDISVMVSFAGDVNGDGISDVIIGGTSDQGRNYVLFGSKKELVSPFNLANLDGSNGFIIENVDTAGQIVTVGHAGDINADGVDDVMIGAPWANNQTGKSYIIYGNNSDKFTSPFDVNSLNGSNGFTIQGISQGDSLGQSVSSINDINADGFMDVVLGAPGVSQPGISFTGQGYVIFGNKIGFPGKFDLTTLNGTNGFTINGEGVYDAIGAAVADIGDINNDGINDLAIGQTYVIFGNKEGFPSVLNVTDLNGSNGFYVEDNSSNGPSVSRAGDFNGDGVDDMIIGDDIADVSGQCYVIFGHN